MAHSSAPPPAPEAAPPAALAPRLGFLATASIDLRADLSGVIVGYTGSVRGAELISLKERIRQQALELGFVRCGFAPVAPLPHADALERWVEAGRAASMDYMRATWRQRCDPAALLPGARSAIVVVASYGGAPERPEPGQGRIARYARGPDYHRVLHERLRRLADLVSDASPGARTRAAVDTLPLLERELAVAAGIGFFGKNTMLISPGVGSYTLIGALLSSLELPPDRQLELDCGSCDECLSACPGGALVAPYELDARRCVSYLTIEHRRGPIDPDSRRRMAPWIAGCDRCQEVCPHNSTGQDRPRDPELAPPRSRASLDLACCLLLRSGDYRRLVRGRVLSRLSRAMIVRNAAIAAAQQPAPKDLDSALARAEAIRSNADLQEVIRWARRERAKTGR